MRSVVIGNSDEAVEPAEPFNADSFVWLMDYIEAGIFSDDSDEEEGEGMEEDEDGDAIMLAAMGYLDVPDAGTYSNPLDLTNWDL